MVVLRVRAALLAAALLAAALLVSGCALWPSPPEQTAVTASAAEHPTRQPLVVIRFDQPDVRYEPAVFEAVGGILERRPDAAIDLVAVAPSASGAAPVSLEPAQVRGQAETVMRSLVAMGLPPSRIAMLASTSPNATTNEVHLYVR